jgi:hypothetical protein
MTESMNANAGVPRLRVSGTTIVDIGARAVFRHLRFAFARDRMPGRPQPALEIHLRRS